MRALVVLSALVLAGSVAACGGSTPSRHDRPATAETAAPALAGPGRLVRVAPGRTLYLSCVGSGSPTVLLEAGFGASSGGWRYVQPLIGRTTRTCAYDRAGLGSSLAIPGVHDARAEIRDLDRLLAAAAIPPPYILAGHSYGGLLVRLFAHAHPGDVAGLVLVDSMGPSQTRRTLAIWPRSELASVRREQAQPVRDGVDLATGEALAARVKRLGATPLVVVTAGRHDAEWGTAPRRLRRALSRLWTTLQDELAAMSSDRVHVVALRSDHAIQGPDGQPAVVVRAVTAVVDAARRGVRLPPCRQLFHGPFVRCR